MNDEDIDWNKFNELKDKYSDKFREYTTSTTTGSGTGDPYWGINHTPYNYPNGTTTTWDSVSTVDVNDITLQEVLKRLDAIERRLKIMEDADPELVEALKEAYDHYKFIEKLCEDSAKEKADNE